MKQILNYAELTSGHLNKCDQFISYQGRPLLDESTNEVAKMIYRITDFEQGYNVSEYKFKPMEDHFHIRRSIEEVRDIISDDLRKKNIEINMRFNEDLPPQCKGDGQKFKQILLNLIIQSITGTYRGILNIKAESVLGGKALKVQIENSKFELHKKDNLRIHKLTLE